jgi:catechol 2,3-dioxygenase-like lactoylglutathione lyase family enzyme
MIGGVFLLTHDPRALAKWYERHLGWELRYLADEGAYYTELYYREPDRPDRPQHLVYAIMPGDPGAPGQGHIINYRVDDIDAIVESLQGLMWKCRRSPSDPMPRDRASSSDSRTRTVIASNSGSISTTSADLRH